MPQSAAAKTHAVTTKPTTTNERPGLEECIARGRRGRDQEALDEVVRSLVRGLARALDAGGQPSRHRAGGERATRGGRPAGRRATWWASRRERGLPALP